MSAGGGAQGGQGINTATEAKGKGSGASSPWAYQEEEAARKGKIVISSYGHTPPGSGERSSRYFPAAR